VARPFSPDDKVLDLLPVLGKPLHAKYHCPYTVLEQLGPVDYVIAPPNRRKTKTSEDNAPELEILSDVAPLFEEHPVTIDTVNRAQLIELQQHDSSLQSLFALCDQENSDYLLQSGVILNFLPLTIFVICPLWVVMFL